LDGWWCEGYTPEAGWVIGAGESYEDSNYQDMVESQALYNLLENEIVPLFYTRSADKLPRAWIRKMKNSIKSMTPRFNTDRMLAEYTRRLYNPAAARWRYLTAQAMSRARALSRWKVTLKSAWSELAIKDVQVQTSNGSQNIELDPKQSQLKIGSELSVRALVKLGKVDPTDVSVELYHGCVDTWGNIRDGSTTRMIYEETPDPEGEYWFAGLMPCKRTGHYGLAVRVLPKHKDLVDPYELGLILWEKHEL
jgi:starch phosphorylase